MVETFVEAAAEITESVLEVMSTKQTKKKKRGASKKIQPVEKNSTAKGDNKQQNNVEDNRRKNWELEEEESFAKASRPQEELNISIDLSGENALQAMIYSEIFGKPRCKRKRRW